MVAWRLTIVAAAALLASCTSIFDSYYPDSVEYLEGQTDLKQALGGKEVVALHMQLLPATSTRPYDVLTIIADTEDGEQSVLFYDAVLNQLRKYSQARMTYANGGAVPTLYPIVQDIDFIHTGRIAYDISGSRPTIIDGSPDLPDFLDPADAVDPVTAENLSGYISVYYEDVTSNSSFPVLYHPEYGDIYVSYAGAGVYNLFAAAIPGPLIWPGTPLPNPRLLAAGLWQNTYLLVVSSGGKSYMAQSGAIDAFNFSATTFIPAKPENSENEEASEAWATSSAAVLRTHSDNASVLRAFAWYGKDLGSIRVGGDDSAAFAFHPDGSFWYAFDPVTGKLSRYKAWW